jgi:hypothetical protein
LQHAFNMPQGRIRRKAQDFKPLRIKEGIPPVVIARLLSVLRPIWLDDQPRLQTSKVCDVAA